METDVTMAGVQKRASFMNTIAFPSSVHHPRHALFHSSHAPATNRIIRTFIEQLQIHYGSGTVAATASLWRHTRCDWQASGQPADAAAAASGGQTSWRHDRHLEII